MSDSSPSLKTDAPEPSMEDILASIRRILAEDGASEGAANPPEPAGPQASAESGSEELVIAAETEVMDPPVVPAAPEVPDRPDPSAQSRQQNTAEVLVLTPDMRYRRDSTPSEPTAIVSPPVAGASTDVLAQLAKAILDRRDIAFEAREVSLEGMVREMLRPLLREWLDRNLPYLIERLVKREIDLMVNRAERLDD